MTIVRTRALLAALAGLAPALTASVGCSMPNSSNPTLAITGAQVLGDSAVLDIEVNNPSDYDLTLDSVNWELTFGPLPVASGTWNPNADLPKGGVYAFSETIPFAEPAIDPSADSVMLSGHMSLSTQGSASNMNINEASFDVEAPVR